MAEPSRDPDGAENETTVQSKRVLIVDDHELVRRGLADLIDEAPDLEVCAEAGSSSEALESIEADRPDVAVIDISLKEGNGMDLIGQIRSRFPSVRLVVSSMHEERLYAERALRAGAMGYVHKQQPAERVVDAIRQVLSGRVYVSEEMSDRLLQRMIEPQAETESSPLDRLSNRELQVLELIGRGLSTSDIAEQLHLSPKTVDTYRNRIKGKLNLETGRDLVRYAVAWTLQRG